MTDDAVRRSDMEIAALKKLLHRLAGRGPHDDPLPIVEAANEAVERVEGLEARVAELENVVETDPDRLAYEQMTKKDKVRAIQQAIVAEAGDAATDKAAMNYKDVKWLFDGEPSPGHCYDLMALAGREDGFNYEERPDGQTNRLTVALDGVNDPATFHGVNKEPA